MPRRARLSLPGIPWHIIQRGNNRSVCFYAEDDYYIYHLVVTLLVGPSYDVDLSKIGRNKGLKKALRSRFLRSKIRF